MITGTVVAPFTGAWIEIVDEPCLYLRRLVAPFTGAWIKIQKAIIEAIFAPHVAPFTGAWIEILWEIPTEGRPETSHPSRVRGLKFFSGSSL